MTRLAILHPSGLDAVELRQTLDQHQELWSDLDLLTTDEEDIGTLSEARGTAKVVQQVDEVVLSQADVVFFCGPIEANRPLFDKLAESATGIVLSPDASLADGKLVIDGINLDQAGRGERLLSPHPGAIALAHLLQPLVGFEARAAVATLLKPVSTHGKQGLDEVLNQTRSLLAFEAAPEREVFATQVAFNLLPTATEGAVVEAQLMATLASTPTVAVQVLQAGVFHSYSISLRVELGQDPGAKAVRKALGKHLANDLAVDPELLGPIDAAAREEVLIGAVEPAGESAYWIWAVMDNLTRGSALNALAILEAIGPPVTH
nr:USG-1 protein homolog [Nerophis lumbriciformis]